MKVKTGKNIYDSEKEPIMIILSPKDKKNIEGMFSNYERYAAAPNSYFDTREDFEFWMDDIPEGTLYKERYKDGL